MGADRARRARRAALLLALAWSGAAAQDGVPYRLVVEPPERSFGLTLGDVVARRLELVLPPDRSLDPASLPEAGRVGAWLEALPPERSGHDREQHIRLAYRVINLDPGFPRIRLPALSLKLRDGSTVAVPAEPLSVTWLSPPEGPPGPLRPDRLPVPASAPAAGTALAVAAALLGAGLLGWLHGPLALGPGRPFQRCLGRLRRWRRQPWDDARRRAALREVHGALDASAGATLLAADLPAFLQRHPRFRPVAPELADFFRISTGVFYRDRPCPLGRAELLALARRCRDAERGLLG